MQYINKSTILGTSFIAVALLLSSCDGGGSSSGLEPEVLNTIDVSQASLVSDATKITGGATTSDISEFTFPETTDENGAISMTIPSSPAPEFAARRTITAGNGAAIGFGDSVVLKYDMFSWTGGELVESSSQFLEAHTVEAGISDDYPMPEYLANSLLGRSLGETVQVVLPVGTEDLPDYLDPTDAYVLVVELL